MTADNKRKLKDLSLSVGATLVLNVVIQFVLYPFLQKRLGNQSYGMALALLSVVSVTANTAGTAANYSRMVKERVVSPSNGDYGLLVLLFGLLSGGIGLFFLWRWGLFSPPLALCFFLLILATAFRYYSDVSFKLCQNSLGYFAFYASVALGYLLGIGVFQLTQSWVCAILVGELCGILFALCKTDLYRKGLRLSGAFPAVFSSTLLLLFSILIENLALNADRLVLFSFACGEDVSIYYTASLFGKVAALVTVPLCAVILSYLVRYEKPLSQKMWGVFCAAGAVLALLVYGACLLGSHLILPLLYKDLFRLALPYLPAAIGAQVCYFISSVLLVVLLHFRGEKKQFYFNLCYGILFFASVTLGTVRHGLWGFVLCALAVNALRLLAVLAWGFLPERKQKID